MDRIRVYFDFTCAFANRLHQWLEELSVEVDWLAFSLLEANRDDDGPPVWDRDEHADNISLLMLAGHELVREVDGDTGGYRSQVFAAWHGNDRHLHADDVLGYAANAGTDADVGDLQKGLQLVGQRHTAAVEHGVFGSSTIVFPSGRGLFVRFADAPDHDASREVLTALQTLADRAPQLQLLEPLRD